MGPKEQWTMCIGGVQEVPEAGDLPNHWRGPPERKDVRPV